MHADETEGKATLSKACASGLKKSQLRRAGDIRLQVPVGHACALDKQRFCDGVPVGEGEVLLCLAQHKLHVDMSEGCRDELQLYQEQSLSDFRLEPRVVSACRADILAHCSNVTVGGGRVLGCLVEHQAQIGGSRCGQEVHRVALAVTSDIRLNRPLYTACRRHVSEGGVCAGVTPGGGRAIECLRSHLSRLDPPCVAAVRSVAKTQARDVLYSPQLVARCEAELKSPKLCGDVPHGGGKALACLSSKRFDPTFGASCKGAITTQLMRHSMDVTLMVSLHTACQDDLHALCPTGSASAEEDDWDGFRSTVAPFLSCLRSKRSSIREPECRRQVGELQSAISENVLLNRPLFVACLSDVKAHCDDVKVGGGRVIACLEAVARAGEVALAPQCAAQVLEHQQQMLDSLHLNQPVVTSCAAEVVQYCAGKEGEHLLRCLQGSAATSVMSKGCRSKVIELTQTQLSDLRLNRGLLSSCRRDVTQLCPSAAALVNSGNGTGSALGPASWKRTGGKVLGCLSSSRISPP